MNVSLTFQFTAGCKVFRATEDAFDGRHQVNILFYPSGEGRTIVTLFAPTMESADALVDAIAACGAEKTTRARQLGLLWGLL